MEIRKSRLFHDIQTDCLCPGCAEISQKLYRDAKGFYASVDETLHDDTVMYRVECFNDPKAVAGHLNWGISKLMPVTVCGECCMTRGHFHENTECQEYYWCFKGSGLLMLMDEEGACWCEEMVPGSLHKIDGHHAHRLINTGDEALEVVCVWNSDAGHDYERVENMPFPVRVYKEDGKIVCKERKVEL